MKIILAFLISFLGVFGTRSQSADQIRSQWPDPPEIRDPIRKLDDKVQSTSGDGWVQFYGKVIEVQPLGIRIDGQYYLVSDSLKGFEGVFFVANFPYQVAEGDELGGSLSSPRWRAKESGVYKYDTVLGGTTTIRRLDYGKKYFPPPPSSEEVASRKALHDYQQKKKRDEAMAATFKFYTDKAATGDENGQYRLGLIYLHGEGVAVDQKKARDLFTKSSAQGNKDAAAELAKLPAPGY